VAQLLAEALKSNTTLTTLVLTYNQIGSDGAQLLAEALKSNTTLTTVDIAGNKIGSDGVQLLVESLKSNTTLDTVDIAGNQIGPVGAQSLAEALKSNTTLTTLDLACNEIGSFVAQLLAEALKSNTTLTTLDLACNKIGSFGAQSLAEALKTNVGLVTLRLSINEIGIDNERMINHLLLENRLISKQKIDHQNKLHEYFNNQQLSDMILIVKKTPVYVHKVVLYARSEFFRQLLETNPNEKLYRIQGDGVEVNLFILLLEYLYSDMFHSISKIPENQRDEFVKMCEEYAKEHVPQTGAKWDNQPRYGQRYGKLLISHFLPFPV